MSMVTNCDPLPGFAFFRFAASNAEERCVYHTGTGPAVVIMHELQGMNPPCINLAEEIAAAGFTVFLPLLFGRPGQDRGILPLFSVCVRREFHLFATGKRSPITDWLRDLCAHVHAQSGGPGIGLIGMCMTGGLVFALCASPAVLAAVTSQPSLPITLFRGARVGRDLGTAALDLESAKARVMAEGMDILGFRYSTDVTCPAERFEEAKRAFGDRFKATIYQTPDRQHGLSRWSHRVLTGTSQKPPESHPERRARAAIIAYLRKQLLAIPA